MADNPKVLTLSTTLEVVEDLRRDEAALDVSFSDHIPAESPADLLDSPIGADQIEPLLQLITVAFGAGGAVIAFVDKLLDVVKKHRKPVKVLDPVSGAERGQIGPDTSREEAERILQS